LNRKGCGFDENLEQNENESAAACLRIGCSSDVALLAGELVEQLELWSQVCGVSLPATNRARVERP
jgi:hypothetical protein